MAVDPLRYSDSTTVTAPLPPNTEDWTPAQRFQYQMDWQNLGSGAGSANNGSGTNSATNTQSRTGTQGGGIPWWFSPSLNAASQIYSGKSGASAQRYAADKQEAATKAGLAYQAQKDYEDYLAAEAAQRGNYEQWKAAQQTQNDLLQAREQRLGALGSLIGAPARMPISTRIPDYTPMPTRSRPSGSARLADYLG